MKTRCASLLFATVMVAAPVAMYSQAPLPVTVMTRTATFTAPYLKDSEVSSVGYMDRTYFREVERGVHDRVMADPLLSRIGYYHAKIQYIIDASGQASEVQWVETNNEAYARLQIDVISRMRFTPAYLNGRPVPSIGAVNYTDVTSSAYSRPPYGRGVQIVRVPQ